MIVYFFYVFQSKHDEPCSLRLLLHGKGKEYGREVKYLGDSCLLINYLNDSSSVSEDTERLLNEANIYGLLDNLKAGLELRPPLLHPQPEFLLPYELQQPLTISQIYNLPLIVNKREREFHNWDLLFPLTTQIIPSIPPSSWLVIDNLPKSASNLNVVCTRLCARIIDVAPLSVQALKDCLWLTCKECSISQRSSCISNNDIGICECGSRLTFLPFLFLHVEDLSGTMILTVSGQDVISLLTDLIDSQLTPFIHNSTWWSGLVFELPELKNMHISPEEVILDQYHQLLGEWIDVAVKVSWSKETVSSDFVNQNDLQINLIGWDSV
ncbi:unnamed protein product [Trichobilharzia szidati]|nr:unnamed protein product [Trichobilharzia szidati]